jgi:cupin superfamily acireductone dioxygenase involved in methionine salvage
MSKQRIKKLKARLKMEGWARGTYKSGDGSVCLIGGVNEEFTGSPHDHTGNGYKLDHYNTLRTIAMVLNPEDVARTDRNYPIKGRITTKSFDNRDVNNMIDHRKDRYENIIISWNDAHLRREDEVYAMLDGLIE